MSIDTRIEKVVGCGDKNDIVRIPNSPMIKSDKCSEFRFILMCQVGSKKEEDLLDLKYEYLPTLYYESVVFERCICSQQISKVHHIRELRSNQIFRCGGDCLKHLSEDLHRRAKQYERQYKNKLTEYKKMLDEYNSFLLNYVILKKSEWREEQTIRGLIQDSRFESSSKTIIWLMNNYKCSYPEIELFINYLSETESEDVNIEKFLLSMKLPNYQKCDCGYYTKAYHTKANYSDKYDRAFVGCGNSKKTPTGWVNGCKFYKFGFLKTKEFGENPLLILAEQVAINNKRLQRICKGFTIKDAKHT